MKIFALWSAMSRGILACCPMGERGREIWENNVGDDGEEVKNKREWDCGREKKHTKLDLPFQA